MERPIRILLVEDLQADAEFVIRALLRAGLTISTERVEDEPGLLEALGRFAPDIVLSDFTLPEFDGVSALDAVRREMPRVPFVFVSGTIGEDRAIEALKRGATDYVLKTNLSRLAPAVLRALSEARMEAARHDAEERLRTNEQRLRDIIETSQDWIWELDRDGRFTFSSGASQSILGYSSEDIIGSSFADLLHPDDSWRTHEMLPRLLEGEKSISGVTARWLRRDGTHRWLERSAIVLTDAAGALTGYRGTEHDLTQRLDHEARIARLNRIHTLLSSVNATVARATDRARLLQDVCRLAVERGGYLRAIIALVNPGTPTVRPVAWNSVLADPLRTLGFPLATASSDGISLMAAALSSRRAAVCNDLHADGPTAIRHRAELYKLGVRAVAVLPMVVDNEVIGTLSFESREPDVFDTEELGLLVDVAAEVGFSLQYFQKEDAVHFLSWFDSLTQLAKRDLFCERLAAVLSSRGKDSIAAVLVVDIERIGFVNDTLGREAGDQLLRMAAQRLKTRLGNPDRLAHFGAGVFAVAFSDLDAASADLNSVRDQVREVFNDPFPLDDREIDLSVRTGLAHFPKDGEDATSLVQNAEAALRRAKETGCDDFDYTVTINSQLAERLLIGQKLNRALEAEQFVLYYQPLVDIERGRVVSAEALLRWQDPDRGLVLPDQFIGLLEQSGQIAEVGQWVFEQVARDALRLQRAGIDNLRMAVNISPLQLRRADFVERIVETVVERDSGDTGLEIEITESMLMEDLEASIEKLVRLRTAGVRVSIDDFGTGYSSLALLARLPIDCLKIDRSFISRVAEDPASMTVVSTIIGLARSFRLSAVAEGVETAEQLKLLRLMKCDLAQGYLFGRPMPIDELQAQIAGGMVEARARGQT
jgi:PAS domain S-box-containing protein/diguanylate cyclase (GGDEF)-like protein